jgi:hypothetical protein
VHEPQTTPDPAAALLGAWSYATGSTLDSVCNGVRRSEALAGTLSIARVGSSTVNVHRGSCFINYTLTNNSSAQLVPSQTCAGMKLVAGTVTLDGTTLRTTQRGEMDGASCTQVDETGVLTKG